MSHIFGGVTATKNARTMLDDGHWSKVCNFITNNESELAMESYIPQHNLACEPIKMHS